MTTKPKSTKPNLNKHVLIYVTQDDIDHAEPCDPRRCMIKVAVARALRVPHGYIHVDATGISVTRRKDFREKAFMSQPVVEKLLLFDDEHTRHLVKPFRFKLKFFETTKVYASTPERKARINVLRAGTKRRKYSLRSRVAGVAIPEDIQKLLKRK